MSRETKGQRTCRFADSPTLASREFTRGAKCRSAGMTSVSQSRRSNGWHRLSVTTNDRTTNCSIALVSIRGSVTDSTDLPERRIQRTSADLHGRSIQVE